MARILADRTHVQILNSLSEYPTVKLLRVIGSPFTAASEVPGSSVEARALYQLAVRNKISHLYLESLKGQGLLEGLEGEYHEECVKYDRFLNRLALSCGMLDAAGIDYVVFKTLRPYPAVPGDIDAVVFGDGNDYGRAIDLFVQEGYREVAADGPCATAGDLMDLSDHIPVDLQEQIGVSHIIYMDKDKLRGHVTKTCLPGGGEVRTLTPASDLATVIIHSVVEQLYLLGEFYTVLYHVSAMTDSEVAEFVSALKENRLTAAARAHLSITGTLCEAAYGMVPDGLRRVLVEIGDNGSETSCLMAGGYAMPHRYRTRTLGGVVLDKMREDKFRRSVAGQLVRMLDPRLAIFVVRQVVVRQRREYYIKDYVKNQVGLRP